MTVRRTVTVEWTLVPLRSMPGVTTRPVGVLDPFGVPLVDVSAQCPVLENC